MGFADLCHQGFQHVGLLHFFHIGFLNGIHFSEADDQLGQELDFAPEAHGSPGPGKGRTNVAVREVNAGTHSLCGCDGGNHFFAGFGVQLFGNTLLKGCQQEIGEKQKRLLFLDDLDDVCVLPTIFVLDGLISGRTQLYADCVGLLV